MADAANDAFELYDLRVEVIVPEGAPIYCGARPGDYFELRGEMLTLPPGQGISIYSLAAVLPLLAAKQRPTHPQRLDDDRRRDRLPRPELRAAGCASRRLGLRRFSHAATTAVPLPASDPTPMIETVELRAGLRDLARHPRRLAARGRPRRGRRAERALDDARGRLRRRHHDLRLRRHLHRRRGADRRLPGAAARARGAEAARRAQGPHQARARSRRAGEPRPRATSRPSSTSRCGGSASSGSTSCSSTGGTTRVPGAARGHAAGSTSCAAPARSARSAAPISIRRTRARSWTPGVPLAVDAGAIFAARRPARERARGSSAERTASRCSATARSRAASSATAGSGSRSRRRRSRTARSPNTS